MRDLEMLEQLKRNIDRISHLLTEGSEKEEEANEIIRSVNALLEGYEEEYIDFQLICDHLEVTLFVTDKQGKIRYVNPSYLKKTGLTEEELIGENAIEMNRQNLMQCDVIPDVLREEKPVNGIGYVPEKDYRGFISGVPVKENGQIKYVITTDWDVYSIMEMQNLLQSLKRGNGSGKNAEPVLEDTADDQLLYISDQMRRVLTIAKTVAKTDVAVLITGETGTGKEVLSNVVFQNSARSEKPFIKINCAAIPQELLESELFGYEEGAFTGAKKGGKKGAFEEANGGTLLLDEIGELPFQVQAKLLRALQENEITRVGGSKPIKLDIRIIAATNRDLLQEIKEGKFREDLYYRLNIMPLALPPLRERQEDIPYIAGQFLEEFNEKYGRETVMDPDVIYLFRSYEWPGNIREMRNLMERMVILSTDGRITKDEVENILQVRSDTHDHGEQSLKEAVAQLETLMIKNAISECGSKNKAAAVLGVDHSTLVRKCQKYGIE